MFDTIFGLPVHALVVHTVVVLLPLSALGVVLMAAVPRWRPALRWPTLALMLAAVASIPVATRSGAALERRIGTSALIADHRALGDTMIWFGVPMLVLAAAFVLADRARQRSAVVTVLAVLAVIASAAATVQVIRTGHAGTTAVWEPVVDATEGG